MTNSRYDKMLAVTKDVKDYILRFFSAKDCDLHSGYFGDSFMYLYRRRFEKPVWLRPYVMAHIYEFFSGQSYHKVLPAVAAAEVFNISTYQSNIIFDDKIQRKTNLDNVNQIISAFISLNIASKMLTKCDTDSDSKLYCVEKLQSCNQQVYAGQYIDLNVLIASNAGHVLELSLPNYLELYRQRCDLIGGTTVANCAAWALRLSGSVDIKQCDDIENLFRHWGMIMQMINDLSDFAVFIDKKQYVRYTDVNEGKITLPFFLILQKLKQQKEGADMLNMVNRIRVFDEKTKDRFFTRYLYKDSHSVCDVFSVLKTEWQICRDILCSYKMAHQFSYLFENIFLNRFSRAFFSNTLLKQL